MSRRHIDSVAEPDAVEGAKWIRLTGAYATEQEAAKAYDLAAQKHFGEFARLNFPVENGA